MPPLVVGEIGAGPDAERGPALRRPAGGPARAVDDAAVRAGGPRRPAVRPRRHRQQGRADAADLGGRGLPRGDRPAPLPGPLPGRGRGGVRERAPRRAAGPATGPPPGRWRAHRGRRRRHVRAARDHRRRPRDRRRRARLPDDRLRRPLEPGHGPAERPGPPVPGAGRACTTPTGRRRSTGSTRASCRRLRPSWRSSTPPRSTSSTTCAPEFGTERLIGGLDGTAAVRAMTFAPTLNIQGLWSGFIGPGDKTITPAEAHARLDIRIVPEQDPAAIMAAIRAHLDRAGFGDIEIIARRERAGLLDPVRRPDPRRRDPRLGVDLRRAVGPLRVDARRRPDVAGLRPGPDPDDQPRRPPRGTAARTPPTRTSGSTTPPARPGSPPASSTSSPRSLVDRRATIAAHERRRGTGPGDHPRGAPARDAEPGHAARGAALRHHPGRDALPAGPLRRPGDRPGDLAAANRRAGRPAARAEPRRHPLATRPDDPGHPRVRGQRPGPARAATAQPALARRGGRDGDLDRHVARRACSTRPGSSPGRSRSSSPARIVGSRATSSRTTSAA